MYTPTVMGGYVPSLDTFGSEHGTILDGPPEPDVTFKWIVAAGVGHTVAETLGTSYVSGSEIYSPACWDCFSCKPDKETAGISADETKKDGFYSYIPLAFKEATKNIDNSSISTPENGEEHIADIPTRVTGCVVNIKGPNSEAIGAIPDSRGPTVIDVPENINAEGPHVSGDANGKPEPILAVAKVGC